MATGERSTESPLMSVEEIKLPSIPVINDSKTCPKCQHFLKNGWVDIHSTLAYSRCRCHRDWKYEHPGNQRHQNEDTSISSKMPRLRFIKSNKRCMSALVRNNGGSGFIKQMKGSGEQQLITGTALKKDLPMLKPLHVASNDCDASLANMAAANMSTSSASNSTVNVVTTGIDDGGNNHPSLFTRLTNNTSSSPSSITKLPQLVSNSVSPSQISKKVSPLCGINSAELQHPAGFKKHMQMPTTRVKKSKHFEFTHLLQYVPLSLKHIALESFGKLDQDGDGHLSYPEVLNGLLGDSFDPPTRDIFETYLKPIYHLLGDATYFGKRDFVLCYCIGKLLRDHKLPKISCAQSKDFYTNIVKPLLSLMYLSATSDGTIPIFVIEDLVKEYCRKANVKIVFRKFKVTNLIEEDGLLSLINAFILAPFLFEVITN